MNNPTAATSQARRRELTVALLGTDHGPLYHTSPTFHANIDYLAGMLPAWIDAMAAGARAVDADIAMRIQAAEQGRPQ